MSIVFFEAKIKAYIYAWLVSTCLYELFFFLELKLKFIIKTNVYIYCLAMCAWLIGIERF